MIQTYTTCMLIIPFKCDFETLVHPSGCLILAYVFTDQPLTLAIFCRVHSTSQIRCSPNPKTINKSNKENMRTFICSTRISRALTTCSSTPNPGHPELSNINNSTTKKTHPGKDIWIPACPVSTTLYNWKTRNLFLLVICWVGTQ